MSSCATARASSTRAATDLDQWKSAHAVETDARTLARGAGRRRRVPRPVGGGRAEAGDGRWRWRQSPIIFAMANPDPEITPPEAQGGAARRDHRHRPLGLSQPGQQRPRLPLHLPRRARRARDRDQRGDEDRRRQCAWPSWRARRCRRKSPRPMAARSTASVRDYIIPAPFDPRLIEIVAVARSPRRR